MKSGRALIYMNPHSVGRTWRSFLRFLSNAKGVESAHSGQGADNVHHSLIGFMKEMNRQGKQGRGVKNRCSPANASVHVLGCGAPGLPKSLYFFTDGGSYMFNCGEGTQRLAHEYKLKLSRLDHIFLTSATWEAAGGLPGMSLTLQDVGIPKITVHGPPGIDDLFIATQKFVVLNRMKVATPSCENDGQFEDSAMTVKYVLLKSAPNKEQSTEHWPDDQSKDGPIEADDTDYYGHEAVGKRHIRNEEMKSLLALPRKEDFHSMCYICRIKPRLGTLDLQKCVNKGIKPGPILGLLKNGEDVTLPNGTVVYAKDVRTPDDPGPVFMVIDVPDFTYLDSLLESNQFRNHQGDVDDIDRPSVIFHFTNDIILQSAKYQQFMKSFSSQTTHLIVNDSNKCFGSTAVHRVQLQLNLLNNEIFPKLNNDEIEVSESELATNMSTSKTLTVYRFRPSLGLERVQETCLDVKEYIEEPFKNEGFESSIKQFHQMFENMKINSSNEEYPKIVFLGTGSCIPNKTRNTSSIMVHIDHDHSILLDCGEGTFGQMVRFYGESNIESVLKNLRGIYISHLHADHHIGLLNVLQQRKKIMERLKISQGALYLLAPKQIMSWLYLYDRRFERILSEFTLVPNSNFLASSETPIDENILNYLNVSNVETCHVKHCPNSFGVSFTANARKITYSGDTMPCNNLIKIGKGSDILIHEATMEDELEDEAFKKFHSTTKQALTVAQEMEAKHTILTHFSQRYARVPRLSSENEAAFQLHNVGLAFDNMQVAFNNLNILPYMYSSLKLLYAEHYEDLESKAAKRAMKRERAISPHSGDKKVLHSENVKNPTTKIVEAK